MTSIPIASVMPSTPESGLRATTRARAVTGTAWWLTLIALATVLGFRATLAKGVQALDLAHAAHGSMALGWSLLLVVQAALADAHRRRAHRVFAIAGITCAIGLVATSLPMLHTLANGAVASEGFRPIGYQLLAMDVLLLGLFVLLVAVALAFVRTPAIHSRALASTGLLALPPGLGRAYMRWVDVDPIVGSHLALLTGGLLVVGLIIRDRRMAQREPVYPAVLAAFAAIALLFPLMAQAGWFDRAMRLLAAA